MFAGSERGEGLLALQKNALVFASGERRGSFHIRKQVISDTPMYNIDMLESDRATFRHSSCRVIEM